MSFLLLIKKELEDVALVKKLRAASLNQKTEMLASEINKSSLKKYYFFSDAELEEHFQNMKLQFNQLVDNINISQVYEH